MTPEEWAVLCAMIDNWWGQPEMTHDREEAYLLVLADYPSEAVERAVRELLAEGEKFTPSAAQLLAKVETPDVEGSLRFGAALRCINDALASTDPKRFLETEHPLYSTFLIEHPELARADQSDTKYLRDLQWEWKHLVEEWHAGIRRRATLAQMERLPLTGGNRGLRRGGPRQITDATPQLKGPE